MLLETLNLEKSFMPAGLLPFLKKPPAPQPALSGITLKIQQAAITGLKGPNGAGKTTLLKILAGRLLPDAGEVRLDGKTASDSLLRRISAFAEPGGRSFYLRLSVEENLRFFGSLDGLPVKEALQRAAKLADRFGISKTDFGKRFDSLSEGTAQKIALIRAIMRGSGVLLLDEPARHLDKESKKALLKLLKSLALEEGKTIVYASHDESELLEIAGETIVLNNGKLLAG